MKKQSRNRKPHRITILATTPQKTAWEALSDDEELYLSEWVRMVLDKEVERIRKATQTPRTDRSTDIWG